MPDLPEKLQRKIMDRLEDGSLRSLHGKSGLVDFASNDYLGFSSMESEFMSREAHGSSGSRLISGNHPLYFEAEERVRQFHQAESALIFNSGYDANIGLLSAILQRGDYIFYDQSVHASIRDGISLGKARSFKFAHNDLDSLNKVVDNVLGPDVSEDAEVYVVTESLFSMEGDGPSIEALVGFCGERGFHLIVDEAHATGILGPEGRGAVVGASCQDAVFARVMTFGKALGCHGAAVLGSTELREYLINFSRSLIYTTALSPVALRSILDAYERLTGPLGLAAHNALFENIRHFRSLVSAMGLSGYFTGAMAAIQCCEIGGNKRVKSLAALLRDAGYDVKPILSPTVPKGRECLRFSLHSYNTTAHMREVLTILAETLNDRDNE